MGILLTALALPGFAFAADEAGTNSATGGQAAATPSAIVADMTFITPTKTLSLDEAYKELETSPTMEQIALAKKSDQAVAKGNMESLQDLKAMEKASSDPTSGAFWSYDSTNKKLMQAMRNFANSMIAPNNEARISKFKRDTFEKYYTLKDMETPVAIASDTVAVNEKILASAELKYKLGTSSKMDVLKAELDLKTAQDGYMAAKNGLSNLKMAFNVYMGYDLMQDVSLSDTIAEPVLPETKLADAVKSALTNRLELKESAYNLELSQLDFDSYKAYPKSSSKYLSKQTAVLGAKMANDSKPAEIELDVRSKYMAMTESYQKVQSGKQSVTNAAETARLAQLQYEAGMCTLTEVQQAQLGSYNAQLNQSKALLEYNLALEDYTLCQGIGISGASLTAGGSGGN